MENITLCGYVHIPGTRSRYVFNAVAGGPTAPGPFVETIQAGAFRQALRYRLRPDVRLTVDHGRVIGSVKGGELKLEEDERGLKAIALIRDPAVIRSAADSELRGWSFGYTPLASKWERLGDNLYRRTVTRLLLHEVTLAVCNLPAYPGTTIELVEVQNGYSGA